MLIEDPALDRFIDGLRPGMRLKGRIVLCLGNHRYLLRIQGFNLVMYSTFYFDRFDEVVVSVERTRPRLKVRLKKRVAQGKNNPYSADIWV